MKGISYIYLEQLITNHCIVLYYDLGYTLCEKQSKMCIGSYIMAMPGGGTLIIQWSKAQIPPQALVER
jgi:hypothetical protein